MAAGVTVLVIAGGATGAWALTRSGTSTSPTTAVVTASVGTLQQTVTTTGTIEPAQDSDLTFSTGGTVTSVAASVGRKVAKGAVLATIDSSTQQTAVTTATAAVTAAEQELTAVASSSATQIAAANAQLASARTSLARAQDDLAATSLTAPFSGVVAAVDLAVGDSVGQSLGQSASGSTSSKITLITTNAWVVTAGVGSADLAQLKKGLQAVITPTGSTTRVFGTIASLGIVASSSTGGSATFPVVIDVTGSPAGLYAGSSADVSLIVAQLPDVLTIPTLAVHTVNGRTVVYQRISGKRVTTPVTVGTSYGASTEIRSGLKAGDQVEISFGGAGGRLTRRTGGGGTGNQNGPPAGFTGGGFPGGATG